MRARIVAVIGGGSCDAAAERAAEEVGRLLAEGGCAVLTGGLGGVMEAASRGADRAGGLVVGVLPTAEVGSANPYVRIPIATGMGDARNAILANTAEAFVAIGGAEGTLSEIAFALKRNKPVVSLGSWEIDPRVHRAASPEEAVAWVLDPDGSRSSGSAP